MLFPNVRIIFDAAKFGASFYSHYSEHRMAADLQESPPSHWESVKYAAGQAAEEVWGDTSAGIFGKSFYRGFSGRTEEDEERAVDPFEAKNNPYGFEHALEPVFEPERPRITNPDYFYTVDLGGSGVDNSSQKPELTDTYTDTYDERHRVNTR